MQQSGHRAEAAAAGPGDRPAGSAQPGACKAQTAACGHCTTALLLTVEITHGAVTRE